MSLIRQWLKAFLSSLTHKLINTIIVHHQLNVYMTVFCISWTVYLLNLAIIIIWASYQNVFKYSCLLLVIQETAELPWQFNLPLTINTGSTLNITYLWKSSMISIFYKSQKFVTKMIIYIETCHNSFTAREIQFDLQVFCLIVASCNAVKIVTLFWKFY